MNISKSYKYIITCASSFKRQWMEPTRIIRSLNTQSNSRVSQQPVKTLNIYSTSVEALHKNVDLKLMQLFAPLVTGDKPSRIGILDPTSIFPNEIDTPQSDSSKDMTLPSILDREIIEPVNKIIEKRAARLIVIRKRKMKKHKYKKLQKKMKFEFAKRRQRREMRKEKAFQAVLINQIKLADKFDAKQYVQEKLEKALWEPPMNRVRGILAPDWVIQEHKQKLQDQEKMKLRLEECMRLKRK